MPTGEEDDNGISMAQEAMPALCMFVSGLHEMAAYRGTGLALSVRAGGKRTGE
jgi:hypothetical protein